jgi:purine-binding chemotaxis protein CheW
LENQKAHAEITDSIDQLISFSIGDEEFGVDIHTVKEVIKYREITSLPKAPAFVKGIINLRGDVIPIIDLRERFGMDRIEYSNMTRIIVVEVDGRSIGTVVDSVSHVIRIDSGQIEPPPPCVGKISADYIRGIGKVGERLVVLLRINKILTAEEKIELGKVDTLQKAS